jgi:transposase
MGYVSDFERQQIVDEHLAGASVTKTATLLGVLRVTVAKVMLAYTNHGKTTPMKRNSGRKLTLTKGDHCTPRRTVLKTYTTTAEQVTAELNIHHKDPVSTKTAQCEFHKSNIHGRVAIARPLITESNAHMHKRWCL